MNINLCPVKHEPPLICILIYAQLHLVGRVRLLFIQNCHICYELMARDRLLTLGASSFPHGLDEGLKRGIQVWQVQLIEGETVWKVRVRAGQNRRGGGDGQWGDGHGRRGWC